MLFINLIFLLILIFLSASFSASETAMFSIPPPTVNSFKSGFKWQKRVYNLLQKTEKLLITILIGNTVVNILATSLMTSNLLDILNQMKISSTVSIIAASAFMTILILVFGEILPKNIAINFPQKTAHLLSNIIFYFYHILFPIQYFFRKMTRLVITLLPIKNISKNVSRNYILSLINIARKEKVIDEGERSIFNTLLNDLALEVRDVMKPRTEVITININTSLKVIINTVINSKTEKIPVMDIKKENIISVINKKDIIPYYYKTSKLKNIRQILRDVIYVPESMELLNLLIEFQKKNNDFAVVIDEYGSYSGIITIKDILYKTFKNIYPQSELLKEKFKKIKTNTYTIKGNIKIEQFNRFFKTRLITESSETIAGYILEKLGYIPLANEYVKTESLILRIINMEGVRIDRILVEVKKK